MYQVLMNDGILYDPRLQTHEIYNPILDLEINTAGRFSFDIYPTHPRYNEIDIMTSYIDILKDAVVIFKGRVISISASGFMGKTTIQVEGLLAVLNDSLIKPFEFGDMPSLFLEQILDEHNKQVDAKRQIKMGKMTVTDPNDYIFRASTQYLKTWEVLKTRLLDLLGGYFVLRYEPDGLYLDYLKDSELKSTQKIRVGSNMLSNKMYKTGYNLITALIPLGAAIEDEAGNLTDKRVDVTSVNDGLNFIENTEAVSKYGYIYDTQTWDDIHQPSNLLNTARRYLDQRVVLGESVDIDAVDLSLVDANIDEIGFFSYVSVENVKYNLKTEILVTKKTINILEPEKNKITLGLPDETITGKTANMDNNVFTIKGNYVKTDQIKNDVYLLDWVSEILDSDEMTFLFKKEYPVRPSVVFDFMNRSDDFKYNFEYVVVDAEGIPAYQGVVLKVLDGTADLVNMHTVGQVVMTDDDIEGPPFVVDELSLAVDLIQDEFVDVKVQTPDTVSFTEKLNLEPMDIHDRFGISFVDIDYTTTPPPTPDNLEYTLGINQITLTWDAVDYESLSGYKVYLNGIETHTGVIQETTYTILDIDIDVDITVSVTAVSVWGYESDPASFVIDVDENTEEV